MLTESSVVGIDVSKESLDVAFGLEPVRRFPNLPGGHNDLTKALLKSGPARVILEATGGYEHRLLRRLADKGLPVVRVNPGRVRDFARGAGVLAKTDAIDARVLVRYGAAMAPPLRPLPSAAQERLAALQTRRAQLVAARTAQQNHLEHPTDAFIKRTIRVVINTLQEQIAAVEAESAEVIAQHAKLQRTYTVLTSVPGIGPVTAAVLMGAMPELGTLSRQAAASLAGLAPFNQDSGTWRGQRHIRGGRAQVRAVLYMATLTGLRCNPVLAADFKRLTDAGKPGKLAMTACMRKLLTIANALVRDDALWGEKVPHKISSTS